jgi:DNA mismatch repair protein MutL
MHLTPEKMDHLIETLWATSSPLFCPHGRPIILRFSDDAIEKSFHRLRGHTAFS